MLAKGFGHSACRNDIAKGGGRWRGRGADEVEGGGDCVSGPIDDRVDRGEEGLAEDPVIPLEGSDHEITLVGESGGKEDSGLPELLGGRGEGAVSKADKEGSGEVGGAEEWVALDEGRGDEVAAGTGVEEEGGLDTIDLDCHCEEVVVEVRGGGEGEDVTRTLWAVKEAFIRGRRGKGIRALVKVLLAGEGKKAREAG